MVNAVECTVCAALCHINCLPTHNKSCVANITPANPQLVMLPQLQTNRSGLNVPADNGARPGSSGNNFQPLVLSNPALRPDLPAEWQTATAEERTTLMMQAVCDVRTQNTQISADMASVAAKINFHSETLVRHDGELSRLSAEQADTQSAFTDRRSLPELLISSIPKDLNIQPDEFAQSLFKFLGFPPLFHDTYMRSARFVNMKNPQASTNSVVIRMVCSDICDEVLTAAAQKRRSTKFTLRNVLGVENDAVVYLNKMESSYIQHLSYLARQAKKKYHWKSVWNHAGNVCIKKNDQSPLITISLISQLEAITQ